MGLTQVRNRAASFTWRERRDGAAAGASRGGAARAGAAVP